MAPSFVSNSLPDANELLGMTIQTLIQLAQKTSPSEAVIDCARIIKAAQKSPLDNIIPNIGNVAYANKVQRPIKTATAPATSPSRIDSKTEVDEDKTPRATTRPAAPIVRRPLHSLQLTGNALTATALSALTLYQDSPDGRQSQPNKRASIGMPSIKWHIPSMRWTLPIFLTPWDTYPPCFR